MPSKVHRNAGLTFHPIGIASVVVLLVLCLALGYHSGVRHAERSFAPRLLLLRDRDHNISREVESCKTARQQLLAAQAKRNSAVHQLRQEVAQLERELKKAEDSHATLDAHSLMCRNESEELQKQIEAHNEEDGRMRREVEGTLRDVAALEVSIQQLTRGEGMSILMLNHALVRLRDYYGERCRNTLGCVVRTDEELIQRWGNTTEHQEAIQAFLDRDAAMQRGLANHSFLGPVANLTDIVLLPALADESRASLLTTSPVYFNRTADTKPLPDAGDGEEGGSPSHLMEAVELFMDYSLCAYRYGNPRFTFPSPFCYLSDDEHSPPSLHPGSGWRLTHLHEMLGSPLLRFCMKCNASVWAEQYRLACFRDRVRSAYGSHDFWVVRSLMQPTEDVRRAAFHYYEARDWTSKRVLAVMLHQSVLSDQQTCDRMVQYQYGLHYLYLKANFANEPALQQHISDDRVVQCSPSLQQVTEYIGNIRTRSPEAFDYIYLSMSEATRSSLESLLGAGDPTGLLPLLLPPYRNTEREAQTPGFTAMVDLEIAARATDILISPFLSSSRYVTESFLLRHHLTAGGHIWTF